MGWCGELLPTGHEDLEHGVAAGGIVRRERQTDSQRADVDELFRRVDSTQTLVHGLTLISTHKPTSRAAIPHVTKGDHPSLCAVLAFRECCRTQTLPACPPEADPPLWPRPKGVDNTSCSPQADIPMCSPLSRCSLQHVVRSRDLGWSRCASPKQGSSRRSARTKPPRGCHDSHSELVSPTVAV